MVGHVFILFLCRGLQIFQACYAALAIQSREFLIIVMWAGQLAGEALSWVIKRIVKQDRPIRERSQRQTAFFQTHLSLRVQGVLEMAMGFPRRTASSWLTFLVS